MDWTDQTIIAFGNIIVGVILSLFGSFRIGKLYLTHSLERSHAIFVIGFVCWMLGSLVGDSILVYFIQHTSCGDYVELGTNISTWKGLARFSSYLGLIVIWGQLFVNSLTIPSSSPLNKKSLFVEASKKLYFGILSLIGLFTSALIVLTVIYNKDDDRDSDDCNTVTALTSSKFFSGIFSALFLSTFFITLGFWIFLYKQYQKFQKEQQAHGSFRVFDNQGVRRTLLKVSVISIICQLCFLIRSALLSYSLVADEFGFAGAIAGLVVDFLAGILMAYGASVQIKKTFVFDSQKLFETDPLLKN
mmetsp:Transcript_24115/g.33813  ORF Transcript_24115/g.33813 Transcript_24115/m.33813 type:complete len:303 (-) Transcript_24115:34-942(-)